ncbi:MAG: hypothetical protein ACP5KN_18910 [Armatimonadota bacterium]
MDPMELVDRAFERSMHWLGEALSDFPIARASEHPGGDAKSFDQIMRHLAACDLWFLECAGIDAAGAPVSREEIDAAGGGEVVALKRRLREYTLAKVDDAGEGALAEPPENYDYPTRLDLWLYAAEHEFWHAGQVQALALLFAK